MDYRLLVKRFDMPAGFPRLLAPFTERSSR